MIVSHRVTQASNRVEPLQETTSHVVGLYPLTTIILWPLFYSDWPHRV